MIFKKGGDTIMKRSDIVEYNRIAYNLTKNEMYGDLHERMQCVMSFVSREGENITALFRESLYALQAELAYHTPAKPPYSKRD